jgi:hypothetical protein
VIEHLMTYQMQGHPALFQLLTFGQLTKDLLLNECLAGPEDA